LGVRICGKDLRAEFAGKNGKQDNKTIVGIYERFARPPCQKREGQEEKTTAAGAFRLRYLDTTDPSLPYQGKRSNCGRLGGDVFEEKSANLLIPIEKLLAKTGHEGTAEGLPRTLARGGQGSSLL